MYLLNSMKGVDLNEINNEIINNGFDVSTITSIPVILMKKSVQHFFIFLENIKQLGLKIVFDSR